MKRSLSLANIRKFDKSNMLNLLLDFPLQCKQAYDIAKASQLLLEKKDFSSVLKLRGNTKVNLPAELPAKAALLMVRPTVMI